MAAHTFNPKLRRQIFTFKARLIKITRFQGAQRNPVLLTEGRFSLKTQTVLLKDMFDSPHPHIGSLPSITSVPGDPIPSSGLCRYQAHT